MNANLDEARRFLSALAPDESTFCFQVFRDRGEVVPWHAHGTLDAMASKLIAANQAGAGVFVTINRTNGKGRTKGNIVGIRAIFADLDKVPLDVIGKFNARPNIVVESSAGKYHVYWKVTGFSVDRFEASQRRFVALFGSDKMVVDCSRVMRLPGFWHQKKEPFQTRIVDVYDC